MSLEITKDTKDTKRILADWLIERWGRCPTPRQGWQGHAPSFSLHLRHVCDVPKDEPDVAQEIQEMQAIQERGKRATDKAFQESDRDARDGHGSEARRAER